MKSDIKSVLKSKTIFRVVLWLHKLRNNTLKQATVNSFFLYVWEKVYTQTLKQFFAAISPLEIETIKKFRLLKKSLKKVIFGA